jgi:IS5 family transposase
MAHDRRQSWHGPSACGRSQRRESGHEPPQRGLHTKRHLAVEAVGLPVSVVPTEGTRADCTQASPLIEGIDADHLIADKGL